MHAERLHHRPPDRSSAGSTTNKGPGTRTGCRAGPSAPRHGRCPASSGTISSPIQPHAPRRRRHQMQYGARRRGLAAAAFADQPQALAAIHRERYVVDRADLPVRPCAQQRRVAAPGRFSAAPPLPGSAGLISARLRCRGAGSSRSARAPPPPAAAEAAGNPRPLPDSADETGSRTADRPDSECARGSPATHDGRDRTGPTRGMLSSSARV